VAQYIGAKRPERVGTAIWQAILFSVVAGALLLALVPLAESVFRLLGHSPELQALEAVYFRIYVGGSGFIVLGSALGSFFTGRGDTVTVMVATALSVAVNIILDYLWIFGHAGFPRMGVAGAAWATVVAYVVYALVLFLLMVRRKYREQFRTLAGCCFDRDLFVRLLRFGLPSGLTMMLDVLVWALFVGLIGRLGDAQIKATTVAFNINALAFMPMIGIGIAVSTLVGRFQGEHKPDLAARATWSGVHLVSAYMALLATLYLVVPGLFISPFAAKADPAEFRTYARIAVVLLRFVALYTIFDGLNIVLLSALRGAGDTRFPLIVATALAYGVLAAPSWLLYSAGVRNVYLVWALATAYVVLLGLVMLRRFLGGKWRTMRVIEEAPPRLVPRPAVPPTDVE
jgi:MATE family multidrug resistance protein